MATDDCSEIGSGPCPCGKGLITVEKCTPDHPWAKAHQVSFEGHLVCDECRKTYEIYSLHGNEMPRLVAKAEVQVKKVASAKASKLHDAVANHPHFKKLADGIEALMKTEKHKTKQLELLRAHGLGGMSIEQYRARGFRLGVSDVEKAMSALSLPNPELSALAKALRAAYEESWVHPKAIKTGVNGMEI